MARKNNTVYNLLNTFTGEYQNFNKVTTWLDGTAMTDAKCDGTIFRKKGTEYFKLNWTGPVNIKWFGAKGDGITDDSVVVQKAINTFKTIYPGQQGGGVTILFPEGTYRLKDIQVPAGINIISYQLARDNYLSYVPSKIMPAPGATDVFIYADDAKNCEMIGIYIDADFENNPNLRSAVRWAGSFNKIINCNFTRCPKFGVLSKCGGFVFQDNNVQGWYGPVTPDIFSGPNDFKGTFHVEAMGDSYIINNEFGAGLPYFTKEGLELLRDPEHRRICAMAASSQSPDNPNLFGFLGNSVIEGNLFENGDRGVALGNGVYAVFSKNRYELSGGTGLTIFGNNTYMTFDNERFSGNSMAGDGLFPDIELRAGTFGQVTFTAPIFFRSFPFPNVPAFANRVNWNVDNKASTSIKFQGEVIDPTYYTQGFQNLTLAESLPLSRALFQYDIDNPRWNTVSTQKAVVDPQTGYVTLGPGTLSSNLGLTGGVQFYTPDGTPQALLGFNASPGLWYTLNQPGGNHTFIGGGMYITKADGNLLTLNATDDGPVVFSMSQSNATTGNFSINLQADHNVRIGANNSILFGLGGSGNIRVDPSGITYLPNALNPTNLTDSDVVARNKTTSELMSIPSTSFSPATGGTGYIQNQFSTAQAANYAISGLGRVDGGLSVAMGANPAYPLQVGTLPSSLGVSAQFTGTVIVADAVNANEAINKGQLDAFNLQAVLTNGNDANKFAILTNTTNSADLKNIAGLHLGTFSGSGFIYSGNPVSSTKQNLTIVSAGMSIASEGTLQIQSTGTSSDLLLSSQSSAVNISGVTDLTLGCAAGIRLLNKASGIAGTANDDLVIKSQLPVNSSGTWTPVVTGITGATINNATYTRSGNVIQINCRIFIPSTATVTTAGTFEITGFPMFGKHVVGDGTSTNMYITQNLCLFSKDGVVSTTIILFENMDAAGTTTLVNMVNLNDRSLFSRNDMIPTSLSLIDFSTVYVLAD